MALLLLCSRSPRRAALLRRAGIPFEAGPAPDVDESLPAEAQPLESARRIAERKARASASRAPGRLVLAADTLVALDGEVLGKPRDAADAERILLRLSGRRHLVATGIALAEGERALSDVAAAHVTFHALDPETVRAYVATGEPLDKAGAYGVQGAGSALVRSLEGDRDTVVGLPVARVRALLARWEGAAGAGVADGR